MKATVVSVRLWIYLCALKYTNSHFATAGACPCARRNALATTQVPRCGADHVIGVDEFTTREEGEKRKKEGDVGSRGLIVSLFTSAGTKVELAGR